MLELFTQRVPETGFAESMAQRAEAAGWDGVVVHRLAESHR